MTENALLTITEDSLHGYLSQKKQEFESELEQLRQEKMTNRLMSREMTILMETAALQAKIDFISEMEQTKF